MRIALLCLFTLAIQPVFSQKEFHVACIAFYNLENLFDTLDSPDTDDFEFTPNGPNVYNSNVYHDKLNKLASVIAELGIEYTPDGPALLGVSEIENKSVLEDLVHQSAIAGRKYGIIHRDSKDSRGVDVALLYRPDYFVPEHTHFYSLETNEPGDSVKYSRDILIVIGKLLGESVVVSVNHWPSRRGGEQNTQHLRNAAAEYNRHFLDSLMQTGLENAIVMGDLNDDPVNDSVRKYLRSHRNIDDLEEGEMYNAFENFYRKGLGTTAYQDAWSLFDQIIVSKSLAKDDAGLEYYKAVVFNRPYLTQKTGPFLGYPFRCYSNGQYTGGYSDHFPVYVLLVKEKA